MTTLAIDGAPPEVRTQLRPFNTIGTAEAEAALDVLRGAPLSGYLGGERRGGYWVRKLEDAWAETFKVKHAVACNSATSGLLAAAAAVGLGPGDDLVTTPFTMSATAAAPAMLRPDSITFGDIHPLTFALNVPVPIQGNCKAIVITNLFGQAAHLNLWRDIADTNDVILIEDNSQSPFATEHGRYAGTIGHIGVFSCNVHKFLQCGEGGIAVTNDDGLADEMRAFVNHGEMSGHRIGLNLRLTEISAAIALAQLRRAPEIMDERISQAEALIAGLRSVPGITVPVVRAGCTHVYYVVALKYDYAAMRMDRDAFVLALQAEGVPVRGGYVAPLYRLPAFSPFARLCPIAEEMHDRSLILFENCAHTATPEQIKQICCAFEKVSEHARQRR